MDSMDVDLPMLEPTAEYDDVNDALVEVHSVEGPLVNGVAAEDVLQGKINNCYFACGISLLAHYRPEAIQDAIQVLPNGQFEVTLYEGKYRPEPVTITVDSNLFVDEDGEPIYTHSSTGELWPMILEKAYAEYKGGSYEAIGQGGKADAFERLLRALHDASSRRGSVFGYIRDNLGGCEFGATSKCWYFQRQGLRRESAFTPITIMRC